MRKLFVSKRTKAAAWVIVTALPAPAGGIRLFPRTPSAGQCGG